MGRNGFEQAVAPPKPIQGVIRDPSATFRAPAESPGFVPVIFDISLKRGVVICGRVTDVVPPRKDGQPFEKGNA